MKLNALTLLSVTGIAPSLSNAGGSDTNSGLLRGLQQHNHDLAGRSAEVEAEFAKDVTMPGLSRGRDLASGNKCTASEMCAFIDNEIEVLDNPYMPDYPPDTPPDQMICLLQLPTEKGCHAKVSDVSSMPVGEPYGPEEVTHVICNACNLSSGEGETELSYAKEEGFEFCFTLGGGVEWQSPPVVGPKWSLNASGQWCWSSKTVTTVISKVKCPAGTKKKAVAYKTMQDHKMILTKEWFQRVKVEWNKHPCAGPAPPGFPRFVEHSCSTETEESIDTSEIYEVKFEDMTCPGTKPPTPSPPDCPTTPGRYVTQEVSKNETHIENIIFEDPLYQFCPRPPTPTTSTSTSATVYTSTSATLYTTDPRPKPRPDLEVGKPILFP